MVTAAAVAQVRSTDYTLAAAAAASEDAEIACCGAARELGPLRKRLVAMVGSTPSGQTSVAASSGVEAAEDNMAAVVWLVPRPVP